MAHVQTNVISTSADQRVAVGGSTGTLVSPGAAVGGTASAVAAPMSNITQNITTTGLKGPDVSQILSGFFEDRSGERQSFTSMADSIASGLKAQGQQLGEIVAAAKAPEQTQLNSILPLAILAIVLVLVWR